MTSAINYLDFFAISQMMTDTCGEVYYEQEWTVVEFTYDYEEGYLEIDHLDCYDTSIIEEDGEYRQILIDKKKFKAALLEHINLEGAA